MNYVRDDIDFAKYQRETEHKTNVKSADCFLEDVLKNFEKKENTKRVYMPWLKVKNNFDFRDGEVTVWAGANGHGKSLVTTQVILSLIGQEQKVCIASLEMSVASTCLRMLRMYCGFNPVENDDFQFDDATRAEFRNDAEEMMGWFENRLWFFNKTGNVEPDAMLGMVRYCANELGIKHVVIDNLQKCIRGTDDYNSEKNFISDLFDVAKETQCHIHLVHHTKKLDKEESMPDKNDIKGSSSITDIVDNVFLVWRNKDKENDIKIKGNASQKHDAPDTYVNCVKQRHYQGSGNGEPLISLWFNQESTQFVERKGDRDAKFFKSWPHLEI